jgi:hypothetical protein
MLAVLRLSSEFAKGESANRVVGQFEVALTGTAFSRDVARAESNRLQPPRDSVFKLTHDLQKHICI